MAEEKQTLVETPQINNSDYTQEELVNELKTVITNPNPNDVKQKVDQLYYVFNKKKTDDSETSSEENGEENKEEFIDLYNEFYAKLNDFNTKDRSEMNLEKKLEIIDKINDLSKGLKGIKATKNEYNNLISQIKQIGEVPSSKVKEVKQKLNYSVMQYRHYIKLTNELKEVSFKKNQELKEDLIKKAESLLELDPIKSFNQLQDLHSKWKNIGPVTEDITEELWHKFSEISKTINLQHRDFYLKIKGEQKKNLTDKIAICEQIEAVLNEEINDFKDWNKRTNDILDLQKVWKTVGPVKKTKDKKIYKRYRKACDEFFDKKQKFFEENSVDYEENVKQKEALIAQVKELSQSTEWDGTSKKIIQLSEDWKKVGYIPFKKSKELWKEFKACCDEFFDNKRKANTVSDEEQIDNLKIKEELINSIKEFTEAEKSNDEISTYISDITHKWGEIGFVPKEEKDNIQNEFNSCIDRLYQKLDINADEKILLRFKLKMLNLLEGNNSNQKLVNEEFNIRNSISKLVAKIQTYQGNISFLQGSSEQSEKIKREINAKIEADQQQLQVLKTKLTIINKAKNNKL
jgi:hypothetical protein